MRPAQITLAREQCIELATGWLLPWSAAERSRAARSAFSFITTAADLICAGTERQGRRLRLARNCGHELGFYHV